MSHAMIDTERIKRKKAIRLKRSLQKELSEHKLENLSSPENEEIDFSKEIHPIGSYINDKEQMIEQMFSVIKGEKLKTMLPSILKNCSLEELKADCLVHLLGMSKKRIFAILEGRDLNSSSDSETDSSDSATKSDLAEEAQISSTNIRSDVEEIDDTLDISVSKNDVDILINDKNSRPDLSKRKKKLKPQKKIKQEPISLIEISDDEEVIAKKKKKHEKPIRNKRLTKLIEKTLSKEKINFSDNAVEEMSSENELQEGGNEPGEDPKKGKTLLEILELEMRARAIRALLKNTQNVEEPVPVSVLDFKSDPQKTEETVPDIDMYDDDAIKIIDDDLDTVIIDVSDLSENEAQPEASKKTNLGVPTTATQTPPSDVTTRSKNREEKNEMEKKTDTRDKEVSWSERWAESKNVKTVLKNNKLCSNIKKRMRFAKLLKKQQGEVEEQMKDDKENEIISQLNNVEEGSIDQLNLVKSLVGTKTSENEQSSLQDQENVKKTDATESELNEEEGENEDLRQIPVPSDTNPSGNEERVNNHQSKISASPEIALLDNVDDGLELT